MDFNFGNTPECEEFFKRHADFLPAFDRLLELTNKIFGRSLQRKDRTEEKRAAAVEQQYGKVAP